MFRGNPRDYFEKRFSQLRTQTGYNFHSISNHLIELDCDVAHCESYFGSYSGEHGADDVRIGIGRFVDRFERRVDGWKIAARVVVLEHTAFVPLTDPVTLAKIAEFAPSRRNGTDVSYQRPLVTPYVAASP
jgi:hypothetical protein